MTVSSPMSAQAKGVPETIQMPKAMIPIEIRNENAAPMLASIPKKSIHPKAQLMAGRRSGVLKPR
jgi:hypothetical protein